MIKWIFTPVHNVIRMTPLTCLTTLACCLLSVYFTLTQDHFGDGFAMAICAAVLIGLLNLGVHELYHKLSRPKAGET